MLGRRPLDAIPEEPVSKEIANRAATYEEQEKKPLPEPVYDQPRKDYPKYITLIIFYTVQNNSKEEPVSKESNYDYPRQCRFEEFHHYDYLRQCRFEEFHHYDYPRQLRFEEFHQKPDPENEYAEIPDRAQNRNFKKILTRLIPCFPKKINKKSKKR